MWKEALTWFRNLWIPLPVEGWDTRIAEYQNGKTVWTPQGHPDAQPCLPWPPEWTPHVVEENAEIGKLCVRIIPTECAYTGKQTDVVCSRCGVPIHTSRAGMENGFSVPSCPKCRKAVRRFIEQC